MVKNGQSQNLETRTQLWWPLLRPDCSRVWETVNYLRGNVFRMYKGGGRIVGETLILVTEKCGALKVHELVAPDIHTLGVNIATDDSTVPADCVRRGPGSVPAEDVDLFCFLSAVLESRIGRILRSSD